MGDYRERLKAISHQSQWPQCGLEQMRKRAGGGVPKGPFRSLDTKDHSMLGSMFGATDLWNLQKVLVHGRCFKSVQQLAWKTAVGSGLFVSHP